MKIYTSYIANIKNLIKDNIKPLTICLYPPKTDIINIASLAPSKSMLEGIKKGTYTEEEYTRDYLESAKCMFTNDELLKRLEYLSDGKDIALCCYEKPDAFCHRHLVAQLFKEYYNIDVEEYKKTDELKMKPLF